MSAKRRFEESAAKAEGANSAEVADEPLLLNSVAARSDDGNVAGADWYERDGLDQNDSAHPTQQARSTGSEWL